jgi:predicted ATP-grasp superfamily ATP-dependent carboligase
MPETQVTPDPAGLIICSGFNQRSVVSLCRTLEACQVEYHIIAHSDRDTILQTVYAHRVSARRNNPALDIDDLCRCVASIAAGHTRRFVIAPTSEALNLYLLRHRHRMRHAGADLPLVSEELYQTVSNKASFIQKCRDAGIATPLTLPDAETHKLPVVAKPYRELTADGRRLYPLLIYTQEDLSRFLASAERADYFLQQYIAGSSSYLLYYFHGSGKVDRFSMRNLIQQPEGKSIVAAEPAELHLDGQYRAFEDLLKGLGFRGLVMIELMFADDRFYMIEANPRMWGPAQLMVDAGTNLLVSFVNDRFGTDLPLDIVAATDNPLYFWWAGFWAPQLSGQAMKWHCNPASFWARYPEFFRAEVYCRQDTFGIFQSEAFSLPVPGPDPLAVLARNELP